jgi:hypothetical protein
MTARWRALTSALVVCACAAAPRLRVDRPEQLPAHTYRVPPDVGRLVVDAAAFAELARAVRADLELDLERYDIRHAETLKEHLFILAVLDALADRWDDAVARLDRIAAVETDPGARVMTGLTIRVWADARAHGGDAPPAFRSALERKVAELPVDLVRTALATLRMMGRTFTPEVCRRLVDDSVGGDARSGPISLEAVHAIVFQRYAVVRLAPVGRDIDEVLARAGIAIDDE